MRDRFMRTDRRPILVLVMLVFAYVGSFFAFNRAHVRPMVLGGKGYTTICWWVEDNPVNRFLVTLYSPMMKLKGFRMPVEWY